MISSINKEMLQQDEYWPKYFHWPTDYFPFNLPACHLTKKQIDSDYPEKSMITSEMSYNLQLEIRLVDEDKQILHTFHPRNSEHQEKFIETFDFPYDLLKGKIGITFIWTFYIPCPEYAKKHPMGVIQFDADHYRGKNTIITITDTRPK